MSGDKTRATRDSALEDALRRIRVLERLGQLTGGALMPWLLLEDGLGTETAPGGGVANSYPLHMGGLLVSPLNAGGTIDPTVYGGIKDDTSAVDIETGGVSNDPFAWIEIRSPGLYRARAALSWYTDWGPARLNYETTNGGDSFFVWDSFIMNTENTMINGFTTTTKLVQSPTSSHNGINLGLDIMFHVDDRAVSPRIRFFMVSDISHTWNAHPCFGSPGAPGFGDPTYDCGGFSCHFVQLSPSGVSDPFGRSS